MTESAADALVTKADELLYEKKDFRSAIELYRETVVLYQKTGELHLAASVLMKVGLGLQDNNEFYHKVIEFYKEAAKIYGQDGNRESYSHALLSAAFVVERAGDRSQAISLFLQSGQGYEDVAKMYKASEQFELAWDNLELACTCWKNAFKNAKSTPDVEHFYKN